MSAGNERQRTVLLVPSFLLSYKIKRNVVDLKPGVLSRFVSSVVLFPSFELDHGERYELELTRSAACAERRKSVCC